MQRRAFYLTLALALAGCQPPTAPGDRDLLTEARARWSRSGGDSYTVEVYRGCFCVLAGRRMLVTVEQGSVVGAEYFDSGAAVDGALITYIPTVPDLFDLIQDALDQKAASFEATYDPDYGYPTRVEIDYSATTADDEITFTLHDLTFTHAQSSSR